MLKRGYHGTYHHLKSTVAVRRPSGCSIRRWRTARISPAATTWPRLAVQLEGEPRADLRAATRTLQRLRAPLRGRNLRSPMF